MIRRTLPLHPQDPPEGDGVYGLPYGPDESLVHLVPVPFEATVSYGTGTARGPDAILAASHQVDLLDADSGRPYRAGIWWHPARDEVRRLDREARQAAEPVIRRLGDLGGDPALEKARDAANAAGQRLNGMVEEDVGRLLHDGRIVGVVGGDHSVALGAIAAHARHYGRLGLLHVDAHCDLRLAYEGLTWSHAGVMRNVLETVSGVERLVQVGVRDFCDEELRVVRRSGGRVVLHTDGGLRAHLAEGGSWRLLLDGIVSELPPLVYVSFDIDGLDPALCPNTGTPVPGGLEFQEAVALLRAVVTSGRTLVGFDLCEVAPGPEGSQWDGNVGARLLYKLIGLTLLSRTTALRAAPGA